MGGAERWEYDYKLQWGGNKLWQSIYINIRKQWGENKLWQQIYINIRIQWGENKLWQSIYIKEYFRNTTWMKQIQI